MDLSVLPILNMADRHQGLTSALAESYLQAARVCLDQHHEPPQEFRLKNGIIEMQTLVDWQPADNRTKNAWANISDATRDGAYICALAATELSMGFYAVKRAETLTGADYYVAPSDKDIEDLEDCFRLEVSGTNLDTPEVNRRLRDKVSQAEQGLSSLPAIAVVVGFKVKLIVMQSVEEES